MPRKGKSSISRKTRKAQYMQAKRKQAKEQARALDILDAPRYVLEKADEIFRLWASDAKRHASDVDAETMEQLQARQVLKFEGNASDLATEKEETQTDQNIDAPPFAIPRSAGFFRFLALEKQRHASNAAHTAGQSQDCQDLNTLSNTSDVTLQDIDAPPFELPRPADFFRFWALDEQGRASDDEETVEQSQFSRYLNKYGHSSEVDAEIDQNSIRQRMNMQQQYMVYSNSKRSEYSNKTNKYSNSMPFEGRKKSNLSKRTRDAKRSRARRQKEKEEEQDEALRDELFLRWTLADKQHQASDNVDTLEQSQDVKKNIEQTQNPQDINSPYYPLARAANLIRLWPLEEQCRESNVDTETIEQGYASDIKEEIEETDIPQDIDASPQDMEQSEDRYHNYNPLMTRRRRSNLSQRSRNAIRLRARKQKEKQEEQAEALRDELFLRWTLADKLRQTSAHADTLEQSQIRQNLNAENHSRDVKGNEERTQNPQDIYSPYYPLARTVNSIRLWPSEEQCRESNVAETIEQGYASDIKKEIEETDIPQDIDASPQDIEQSEDRQVFNAQGHASNAEKDQTQTCQTFSTQQKPYLVIDKMSRPVETRIDPTLLLPEEEMTYEIKTKKKKKKKKNKEDPLGDCIDIEQRPPVVIEYDCNDEANAFSLDPDVTIKVEDVDIDFHGISADDAFTNEDNYNEPEVSLEDTNANNAAVILTFQKNLNKDYSGVSIEDIKREIQENYESDDAYDVEKDAIVCKICHMVFKNRNTLTIHKARKHNIKKKSFKYLCQWCSFSYEQKTSLDTHIKRKHNSNANPEDYEDKTCTICALVFKGISRLRMHMQRKHDKTPSSFKYKCNYCKLSYERRSSLRTHKQRKHSSKRMPGRKFKCRLCPKIYDNRDTYMRHLQRNHDPENETAAQILDGLIKKHKTAGELPCSLCPMMFSRPSYLKLHMRRHHSAFKDEYRIKCPYCDMSYNRNESLKRHLLRKHSNNMYCDVCHKNFNTQEEYNSHKHKKKVHECGLCSEIFANQGGLSKHMRCTHKIESGGKNVKCNLCPETFNENRQLKTHMLRDHLKLKYPCKYCNKVFKTKDSYQNHCTKMHSYSLHATADYNCEACNVNFSTERELCSHKLDVHRVPLPIDESNANIKIEIETPDDETNRTKLEELKNEKKEHEDKTHENKEHEDKNYEDKAHKDKKHEIEVDDKNANIESPTEDKDKDFPEIAVEVDIIRVKEEEKTIIKKETKPTKRKIESKQIRRVLYDCTKCSEQFSNFPLLRQHFYATHKQMEETQCQSCGEILLLKDLDKHTKTRHAAKVTFKCNFCDFETNTRTTLSQHTLRHENTKSIACKFQGCKYKSFYQEAMEKHLKKHSQLGDKLQCSRCPFQTMNKYLLKYHEEEHETGNKKYKCDQCSYATIMPANLVQHKFKHSTEKKFKCHSCPFETKHNTSLRFHVRKKHCDLPNSVE